MDFISALKASARPKDVREAIDAIKAAFPGKGEASKYLATTHGVSVRTAQKWLKGDQLPSDRGGRRAGVQNDIKAHRRVAADRMRKARTVAAGRVRVVSISKGVGDGTRNIGVLAVDERMRQELEEAARLFEAGDDDGAEKAASNAILGGYGQAKGGNRESARGALEIDDFTEGLYFS